jgi:hypothetical protein
VDSGLALSVVEIAGWIVIFVALTLATKKRLLEDPAENRRLRIAFIVLGIAGGVLASWRVWMKYVQ